jgi:uncharacterized membrane protein YdjX (TVP38/TMEM64 family)
MSLLTCHKVRIAVAVAASLFVLGLALQAPRLFFQSDFPALTTLLSGSGLFAMLLSPLIMLVTATLALIPGISRRLEICNH